MCIYFTYIDIYINSCSCKINQYVSKSDILGPIAYLSDIEILISFERAMFE